MTVVTEAEQIDLDTLTQDEQDHYRRIREAGQSHNWALMIASRTAPHCNRASDRMRRGRYISGLADFPDDPTAVVHSTAELKQRCEEKGATMLDAPMGVKTGHSPAVGKQKGKIKSDFRCKPDMRYALGKMSEDLTRS